MTYVTFLLFGALGGFARGFVGAMKLFKTSKHPEKIQWSKLSINIIGSALIGAVVGVIVDTNPVLALTTGYAGIDVIESLVKIGK